MRSLMRPTRRAFLGATLGLAAAAAGRPAAAELGPGSHPLGLDHERDGLLYLPSGYTAGVPMPLLVLFHGTNDTAGAIFSESAASTDLSRVMSWITPTRWVIALLWKRRGDLVVAST